MIRSTVHWSSRYGLSPSEQHQFLIVATIVASAFGIIPGRSGSRYWLNGISSVVGRTGSFRSFRRSGHFCIASLGSILPDGCHQFYYHSVQHAIAWDDLASVALVCVVCVHYCVSVVVLVTGSCRGTDHAVDGS